MENPGIPSLYKMVLFLLEIPQAWSSKLQLLTTVQLIYFSSGSGLTGWLYWITVFGRSLEQSSSLPFRILHKVVSCVTTIDVFYWHSSFQCIMKFTTNFAYLAVAILCATTFAIPLPSHPGEDPRGLKIQTVSLIQYDDCVLNFGWAILRICVIGWTSGPPWTRTQRTTSESLTTVHLNPGRMDLAARIRLIPRTILRNTPTCSDVPARLGLKAAALQVI